jgi:acetylornithine/succinyldiaminopimelate/putrescine aminotransferase
MEVNLFTQMVVTSLLSRHRILTQVAAHGLDTLKILPPLMITTVEVEKFVSALDSVLRDCRKFPGPLWDLGANFLRTSLRKPASVS